MPIYHYHYQIVNSVTVLISGRRSVGGVVGWWWAVTGKFSTPPQIVLLLLKIVIAPRALYLYKRGLILWV